MNPSYHLGHVWWINSPMNGQIVMRFRPISCDLMAEKNNWWLDRFFLRSLDLFDKLVHSWIMIFSRVLRDSISHCVCRSVGRSVCWSRLSFFGVFCSCPIARDWSSHVYGDKLVFGYRSITDGVRSFMVCCLPYAFTLISTGVMVAIPGSSQG